MIAIAIDGPGGAGKSTMARALAKELGYIYVDTGALYRAIGLYMRRKGIPTTDFAAVAGNLGGVEVRLAFRDGEQRVFLAEEDVSDAIRTQDISIAGYDGTRMSQLLHPQLTTIRQDTELIGSEAAKRLIGSIEKPRTTLVERVVIEGILVAGKSVGRI